MQDRTHKLLFVGLLLIGGLALQARTALAATAWQDHASILAAARSFLTDYASNSHTGRTEVHLGRLDRRLRLKACPQALEGFLPPGGRSMGSTTVGVRCPGDPGWSIYVPAKIDVFGKVAVLRQPLARGAPVRAGDVELVERNLAALPHGYFAEPGPVVGMLARRTLAASTVLTPAMLQAPRLVKRGERVTLIAETGALKVRMTGEALSDGASGDLIRVRTSASRRVVDGRVVSQGVVKVTL